MEGVGEKVVEGASAAKGHLSKQGLPSRGKTWGMGLLPSSRSGGSSPLLHNLAMELQPSVNLPSFS